MSGMASVVAPSRLSRMVWYSSFFCCSSCSCVLSPSWMKKSKPAFWMFSRRVCMFVCRGSYSTLAVAAAKLTVACSTPSALSSICSTLAAHPAHRIPVTGRFIFFVSIFVVI